MEAPNEVFWLDFLLLLVDLYGFPTSFSIFTLQTLNSREKYNVETKAM